jgi:hypothetical protein
MFLGQFFVERREPRFNAIDDFDRGGNFVNHEIPVFLDIYGPLKVRAELCKITHANLIPRTKR